MASGIIRLDGGLWYAALSWFSTGEYTTNDGYLAYTVNSNTITISFLTVSRSSADHAENTVIFTVPSQYRPKTRIYIPVWNGTNGVNMLYLKTNGEATLWLGQSNANGRIGGTVTYIYKAI